MHGRRNFYRRSRGCAPLANRVSSIWENLNSGNLQYQFSSIARDMQCERVTKNKEKTGIMRYYAHSLFFIFVTRFALHVIGCESNKRLCERQK